jgi:hypothetical protein
MNKKIILIAAFILIVVSIVNGYSRSKGTWVNDAEYRVTVSIKAFNKPLGHRKALEIARQQVIDDFIEIICKHAGGTIDKDKAGIIAVREFGAEIKSGSTVNEDFNSKTLIITMTYSVKGRNLKKRVEEAHTKS